MKHISEEFEASDFIDDVVGKSSNYLEARIAEINGKKLELVLMARGVLFEYLLRTDWKHDELQQARANMSNEASREEPDLKHLRSLQMRFVDKTESFHRNVYGTLSVLIMLLSHACPKSVASQLPIGSVQKFIFYMSKNIHDEDFKMHCDVVLESVQYRANLIDHPQQSKLHDWMTMGYSEESIIVHFVPLFEGDEPVTRKMNDVQRTNPRSPNFAPAVACSSFVVSPNYNKTYSHLCGFITDVLAWCASQK